MDFQGKIDEDLKIAMKARQADRLGVIRLFKSALKNAAIEQAAGRVDGEALSQAFAAQLSK